VRRLITKLAFAIGALPLEEFGPAELSLWPGKELDRVTSVLGAESATLLVINSDIRIEGHVRCHSTDGTRLDKDGSNMACELWSQLGACILELGVVDEAGRSPVFLTAKVDLSRH
jgi:hypothetical protein